MYRNGNKRAKILKNDEKNEKTATKCKTCERKEKNTQKCETAKNQKKSKFHGKKSKKKNAKI